MEPLSGPFAAHGADNVDGLNLYLASIDSMVDDRRVELEVADSQGTAASALAAAQELVESRRVPLLMGLHTDAACTAVAEYAGRARVPLAITGRCGQQDLPSNPYVTRFTHTPSGQVDTAADWAAKNGYRKAVLFTTSAETSDAFANAFVARGGQVVQALHPAAATADFGPLLAQLSPAADVVVVALPGKTASQFAQQYTAARKKPLVLDVYGRITGAAALPRLGGIALGMVGVTDYFQTFDSPANRALVARWRATYGDRPITEDAASGYAAGQLLEDVLKGAAGKVEEPETLLQALYYADVRTAKGRLRLDLSHDVVQTTYVYRVIGQDGGPVRQLLQTYVDVGRDWDRPSGELSGAVKQRSLYQFFG